MYKCICYKNVEIKLSAHDAFLEGTLIIERLESQVILHFGSNKNKGPNVFVIFLYDSSQYNSPGSIH